MKALKFLLTYWYCFAPIVITSWVAPFEVNDFDYFLVFIAYSIIDGGSYLIFMIGLGRWLYHNTRVLDFWYLFFVPTLLEVLYAIFLNDNKPVFTSGWIDILMRLCLHLALLGIIIPRYFPQSKKKDVTSQSLSN